MSNSLPIIFCIDVEPDEFTPEPDRPVPWRGFEVCAERLQPVRELLQAATGTTVHFSWFVRADPQVQHIYGSAGWAFSHYAEILRNLLSEGDEIGLHAHAARYSKESSRWIEDFGSQEWVSHCLAAAFDAYVAAFGAPCKSVRLGNHFMNDATSDLIERLGARFDLTPEPGARPRNRLGGRLVMTGELPDYSTMQYAPYRRAGKSFRERDDGRDGLWVVPLSTAIVDADTPDAARAASDDGAYLRLGLWYPPAAFAHVFESCLRKTISPHLSLVMRSDMPLVPVFDTFIKQNIDWIANHPLARRFMVCRPDEAVEILSATDGRATADVALDRAQLAPSPRPDPGVSRDRI